MSISYNWPIVGNAQVVNFLQKSVSADRMAHAYLFTGPRLVGKTRLAKYFANTLICDKRQTAAVMDANVVVPCGECIRCREWQRGIYPDVYWLEREKKKDSDKKAEIISVAQVRMLIDKIAKRSFGDSYKIIIVPNAEALGGESSNGLLKTLEEPGIKTVIILMAPHKDAVLPTIYSRCQEIRFFPVKSEEIYKGLLAAGVSRGLANELSKTAQGKPTLAERFADNPEEYELYKERVTDVGALLKAGADVRFRMMDKFSEKYGSGKEEWRSLLDGFACVARDALLLKINGESMVVNSFAIEDARALADKFSAAELAKMISKILGAENLLSTNVNLKMWMENILINF